MFEEWVAIEEFPAYLVSNTGLVMNDETGRLLNQSYNPQGAKKVNLMLDKRPYTRSVKFLVATAFVEGKDDINDTAMNLDRDQSNNHSTNLVWRPRWFAHKYIRQFETIGEWYLGRKVYDVETKETYDDMVEAALHQGLLLVQILKSIHNEKDVCYPNFNSFAFSE